MTTQNIIEKKFDSIEKYKSKMLGIDLGLDILASLNKEKLKKESGVSFYNFLEKKMYEYSFASLNEEIFKCYHNRLVYNNIVISNKLYILLADSYDKVYGRFNYKYYKNIFDKYDVINKFLHGLRVCSHAKGVLKFNFSEVLSIFTTNFFHEELTPEEFYVFMLDFVLELWNIDVINFDQDDLSIEFNPRYQKNLYDLVYFSFNLMLLGDNKVFNTFDILADNLDTNLAKIYDIYLTADEITRIYINDLLVSLVISSSVAVICAENNINNIFIESIKSKW